MSGNRIIFVLFMAILCLPQYVSAQAYSAPGGGIYREEGMASWYGPEFDGRPTASGEIFNSTLFTAAHPELPFGTFVRVTNKYNNRQVTVKVNDRGPFVASRIIDLSRAAAEHIDMVNAGIVPVIIETLTTTYMPPPSSPASQPEPPAPAEAAPAYPYPPITLNVYQPPSQPQPATPPPPPPPPVQPQYQPQMDFPYQTMPQYQLPPQIMYQQPSDVQYQYQQVPQYQPAPQYQLPPQTMPQPLPPLAQSQPDPYQSLPQYQIQELYPNATIYPPTNVPQQPNNFAPAQALPPVSSPPMSPPLTQTLPPQVAPPLQLPPPQITSVETLPPLPSPVSGGVKLTPSITPSPGSNYKLQIGSYKEPRHAVDAFTKLKNVGLNPSYEPNGDFYRVVLSGISGLAMQSTLDKIASAGFREALIREER